MNEDSRRQTRRGVALAFAAVFVLSAASGDAAPADAELRAAYEKVDGSYYLRLSRRRASSRAEIELGKSLFFDPRLSRDKTLSCASCHRPEKAWTDGRARAIGRGGRTLTRNTQSLLDLRQHTLFFWDGRASRLTDQVLFPIQEHSEMAADLAEVLGRLRAIGGYREAFSAAYGRPANAADLAQALAAFSETLETPEDSAFDRGREDAAALSASARRGFRLFTGKARCLSCHQGPLFTDHRFHALAARLASEPADPGRWSVVPATGMFGAFLTPSLRNVALTAPYMHDGRFKTLAQVVEFYNRGGGAELRPLGLSAAERSDLVSFLRALTSSLPKIELPVLPGESSEIPARVPAAEAAAPRRESSATDRREPSIAAPATAFTGTLAEACRDGSFEHATRALRSPSSGTAPSRDEIYADAVRVHVFRALAGGRDEACAPLRGLQYDFSGVSQSAEFFCLDWYHELDLILSASDPVALKEACLRGIAWSYRDFDEGDVRAVCDAVVKDIARPQALCASLTPNFLDPRLKYSCEREFRLIGGMTYSCPHSDEQSWTERRCEEYSLAHQARLARDPSVCGERELCRALSGGAASLADSLERRVLARACGQNVSH